MWKIWEKIVVGLFMIIVIGFVLFIVITTGISSYKEDNYCEDVYPSRIDEISIYEESWGMVSGIERGYIKCCRRYYELHERKIECQIFPYSNN